MRDREAPLTIHQFGARALAAIQCELPDTVVEFRGSFASGQFDGYSDVDIKAQAHQALHQSFFKKIQRCLEQRFGPSSIRYVPDQQYDTQAQDVRISFHNLPIFWRIDLDITSDRPAQKKWPDPFPRWSIPESAFWNLVWAVKYALRGKAREHSDHYVACACEKLARPVERYSKEHVLMMLLELETMNEIRSLFIDKLRDELGWLP